MEFKARPIKMSEYITVSIPLVLKLRNLNITMFLAIDSIAEMYLLGHESFINMDTYDAIKSLRQHYHSKVIK